MMLFSSTYALNKTRIQYCTSSPHKLIPGKYGISNGKKKQTQTTAYYPWTFPNYLMMEDRKSTKYIYIFSQQNLTSHSIFGPILHGIFRNFRIAQSIHTTRRVQCILQSNAKKKTISYIENSSEITTWSSRCFTATNDSPLLDALLFSWLLCSTHWGNENRKAPKLFVRGCIFPIFFSSSSSIPHSYMECAGWEQTTST